MKGIRAAAAVCLALALLGGMRAGAVEVEPEKAAFTLGIYTTTDMDGKCYDEDPLFDMEIPDSYLKVASAMAQERKANDAVILLDNGGFAGGTSMAWGNVEIRGGEENPMALSLRYCGYDAVSLSTQEFRFNGEARKSFQKVLSDRTPAYPGVPVEALCANELDKTIQQPKAKPYVVRSFQAFEREYRVGVLSFGETARPEWSRSGEYSGTEFAHEENEAESLAYEWNHYWERILREEENCDYVIVMLPFGRGGGQEASGGVEQEDRVAAFVRNTTGIDMIVAGRDHVSGVSALMAPEGKVVPVVNGGGSGLTKTVLKLQENGSIVVVRNECLKLSDYENDKTLKRLMKPYYESAVSFVEGRIGTLTRGWDKDTSHYYATDDTTDLFHEIQLWATGAELSMLDAGMLEGVSVAQLSKQAGGTPISIKDCWELFPYGDYRLCVVEMTGRHIKDWLELCVSAYTVDENGTMIGGCMGADQIANLRYEVYLGAPVGSRVENITYQDRLVTERQTFRVAVSSRRLNANAVYDEYGWYAVTGIGLDGEKVLWDSAASREFGGENGSFFSILVDYVKTVEEQEKRVMPTDPRGFWTVDPGDSAKVLEPVTRLELIERLYQISGESGKEPPAPFSDVNNVPAVNWAYAVGISKGNGSGQFCPEEAITREQAMVMFFRYDQIRGKVPKKDWQVGVTYVDAAKISVWSGEALMWNEICNYLTPDVENYLRPDEKLLVGQLNAVMEKLK